MALNLHRNFTLALADDDEDDHFFVKTAVSEFKNVSLLSFFNGEELLRHLYKEKEAQNLPDLVILDCNMPKLGGLDVVSMLHDKKEFRGIHFVIVSTTIRDEDRQRCKELNVDCHIKPRTIPDLKNLLETLIARTAG